MAQSYFAGIFPVPVIRIVPSPQEKKKILESCGKLINNIDKYNKTINGTNTNLTHYGDHGNILDDIPEVKKLLEHFCSFEYKNTLGYKSDLEIKQSWINVCEEGGHQEKHSHPNCLMCGTTFIKKTKLHPPLAFFSPYVSERSNVSSLVDIPINKNQFNLTEICFEQVDEGDTLMWPSWLLHGYQRNTSDTRISLSFNMMPTEINHPSNSLLK